MEKAAPRTRMSEASVVMDTGEDMMVFGVRLGFVLTYSSDLIEESLEDG